MASQLLSFFKDSDRLVVFGFAACTSVICKATSYLLINKINSMMKKKDRVEIRLRDVSRYCAVVALVLLMIFGFVSFLFDGKVAKVPFVPVKLLKKISQRNLPGSGYHRTDLLMALCYLLFSISLIILNFIVCWK